MFLFTFFQAHQVLMWVLFLAPLFVVLWRGSVLDTRAQRYGMKSRYSVFLLLGFMPLVNLLVALACIGRTWHEYRTRHSSFNSTW